MLVLFQNTEIYDQMKAFNAVFLAAALSLHFYIFNCLGSKSSICDISFQSLSAYFGVTVVETIGRKASLDLRVKKWVNSEQAENWDLNMSSPQVVDWRKCIICQKETAEKTQCPANSK